MVCGKWIGGCSPVFSWQISPSQKPNPAAGVGILSDGWAEQPHAPVEAQGRPAGEQLCREGPGCPGGWQADHEPAVCPGCQESQWDPGVHQEECGQQVEGGSPPPLHCPSEASSAVLCPVLGSPVPERWEATGESPAEGYEDVERTGASLLRGEAEGAGLL